MQEEQEEEMDEVGGPRVHTEHLAFTRYGGSLTGWSCGVAFSGAPPPLGGSQNVFLH